MTKREEENKKLQDMILELDEKILHNPDDSRLFYQRGWIYFWAGDEERAKIDYLKAMTLGMDATQVPYYAFIQESTYSLRDKIVLSIAALIFIFIIGLELLNFWHQWMH